MYFDSRIFTNPRSIVFDQKGTRPPSVMAHPDDYNIDHNVGTGASIDDCFMNLDVRANDCITGELKGILGTEKTPLNDFNIQAMRKRKR